MGLRSLMDPRNVLLIKKIGAELFEYISALSNDPTLNLFDQIKYSHEINNLRTRSYFRQKTPIVNHDNIKYNK